MASNVVDTPSIKNPIQPSPGFAKKGLSDYKLDACGLCGFGCRYCSSNVGNYLRINRKRFADLTEAQLGRRALPLDDPSLMFVWTDFLERLHDQLSSKPASWGQGKTLVYSMLTDGFSPELVHRGVTEETLRLILDRTAFRIRVLTKNAVVGSDHWIEFFQRYPGRFVVGLSIGTADDRWARKVEIGTSLPTARLRAMHSVQQADIPTYGMLCPVFPDVLRSNTLELLVESLDPNVIENLWAEPYNDRLNWRHVRNGYDAECDGYKWLTDVFENGRAELWSRYAAELYCRLRAKAETEGWLHKLRYLLYERRIEEEDAPEFAGLEGVWLQSKPDANGKSQNSFISGLQS
jgi:DNA repair photolyase